VKNAPPPQIFCSYTQGGWGAKPEGNNSAQRLADNFAAAYPSGVEVGIAGAGGFSMKFSSAPAIQAYLPASRQPKALTADLVNPTSSASGNFGAQVLALQLNVDFSAASITTPGFGSLILTLCRTRCVTMCT
jgi:hypothetical protein